MNRPATHPRVLLVGGLFALIALFPAASGGAPGRAQTAPANTSPPTISGERREGSQLQAQPGSWTGTQPITFTHQWLRCNRRGGSCDPIPGATRARYRLTGNDVGQTLRVRVRAKNTDGTATATSAQTRVILAAGTRPVNTGPPTISGTPTVGQTLSASPGTWTGRQPITYTYQWQRCDKVGGSCAAIDGANANTYVLTEADLDRTLRVAVTARNGAGSASRTSVPTAVIGRAKPEGPAGQIRLPGGKISIPVSSVSLPARLIIDQVRFSPSPVRSRTEPIQVRVHISDTRGYYVRGALIFVRSTPLLTTVPPETATELNGWLTLTTEPRLDFPLKRGFSVQFFVRARKAGENLLAGVSSRRLAQVATVPPG
jgi:hypothetical protein